MLGAPSARGPARAGARAAAAAAEGPRSEADLHLWVRRGGRPGGGAPFRGGPAHGHPMFRSESARATGPKSAPQAPFGEPRRPGAGGPIPPLVEPRSPRTPAWQLFASLPTRVGPQRPPCRGRGRGTRPGPKRPSHGAARGSPLEVAHDRSYVSSTPRAVEEACGGR